MKTLSCIVVDFCCWFQLYFFFSKTSMIYQCCGCESFLLQPFGRSSVTPNGGTKYQNAFAANISSNCDHCGCRYHVKSITNRSFFVMLQRKWTLVCSKVGGPIWNAPICDSNFVGSLLESCKNSPDDKKLGTEKRIFGLLSVIQEVIGFS